MPRNETFEDEAHRLETIVHKTDVDINQLPLLVRFKDIKVPSSITQVDPANLAASFGPGVRLKSATFEITKDAVTTGIEKRLPWLSGMDRNIVLFTGNKIPGLPGVWGPVASVPAWMLKSGQQ